MIVGTVCDPTGAAVPDARVVVTNLATLVTQAAATNSDGQYVLLLIQVGAYSISVEKTGFQESIEKGINVDVQSRLQVDFTLQVGAVLQQVTVTGAAPLLDTQSADVGQVVGEKEISELPLNGRRYDDLVFLTTGVTSVTPVMANHGEGAFSGSGANSKGEWVTVMIWKRWADDERVKRHEGSVCRAPFRPGCDHPLCALVPMLQAQLS
jgi:hypothetical protein